ncbi:MAG: NPCBM/NEW2 domain-containing protein [Phycisphaerales bacterium]|nr:NPCBM/NEW2 domain-containing protein [Phycisphaerales bacterium]MCB9858557.1 NPCBM/NEW2 domain-containing protein [Phycisphaerales bacterium]
MSLATAMFAIWLAAAGQPSSGDDSPLRVSVRSLSSDVIVATLIAVTPDSVKIEQDGEARTIPLNELLQVTPLVFESSGFDASGDNFVTCFPIEGGELRGRIVDSDGTGMLRMRIAEGRTVDIPFSAIAAVRFGSSNNTEMMGDFDARRSERKPGRDVLLVARDGRATAVPGALERLSTDGWVFRYGSRIRNGPLGSAYGVVLGSAAPRGARGPVAVSFGEANVLYGHLVSGDGHSIALDVASIGRVEIDWKSIRDLNFDSGRVVRLSEVAPTSATCESIIGGDWPAQRNRNVTGGPLRIAGRSYEDGWGVHARSRIEFALDGQYEQFAADVGVDSSVGMHGSVVFRVIADGEVVFESDVMRGGQAARRIKVPLGSAKQLVLECDRADGLDLADHANWANAYLVRRKESSPS